MSSLIISFFYFSYINAAWGVVNATNRRNHNDPPFIIKTRVNAIRIIIYIKSDDV
jgi:hypothetical protein